MPVALIVIGIMLIVSGVRGTSKTLYSLFASDAQAFIAWAILIVVLSIAGVSKTIRPLANIFLALLIVVYFLRNGTNIFSSFKQLASNSGSASITTASLVQHQGTASTSAQAVAPTQSQNVINDY